MRVRIAGGSKTQVAAPLTPGLRDMGWHSYVVPYETDEQLQALLDSCKLHNSSPPATNVFVRYHEGGYRGLRMPGACRRRAVQSSTSAVLL